MLKRYPAQLSGGQQQRVSLMRALMLNPAIMLLDEPFAALDPLIRNELQQNISEIFRKLAKTVIWVTHDLNEAAFVGDNIVLLKKGEIIQSGSIEDLVNKPEDNFVKQFVSAQRSHLPEANP
jgi:osmoprotectant transport system ATP-binding protein